MTIRRKPTRGEEPPEPLHPRIAELSPFLNGDVEKRRVALEADQQHPNLALVNGTWVGVACRHWAPQPETNDCRFRCAS